MIVQGALIEQAISIDELVIETVVGNSIVIADPLITAYNYILFIVIKEISRTAFVVFWKVTVSVNFM